MGRVACAEPTPRLGSFHHTTGWNCDFSTQSRFPQHWPRQVHSPRQIWTILAMYCDPEVLVHLFFARGGVRSRATGGGLVALYRRWAEVQPVCNGTDSPFRLR